MKILYLIRGVSGSGKSHLASQLCPGWHPFRKAIAADDYPGRYLADGSLNPAVSHQQAHQWVQRQVDRWMSQWGMQAIAVHNVFSKTAYLEPYLKLAARHGWSVQVIHAEAVVLDSGAIAQGVHGVPEELQQKWIDEWEVWRSQS